LQDFAEANQPVARSQTSNLPERALAANKAACDENIVFWQAKAPTPQNKKLSANVQPLLY